MSKKKKKKKKQDSWHNTSRPAIGFNRSRIYEDDDYYTDYYAPSRGSSSSRSSYGSYGSYGGYSGGGGYYGSSYASGWNWGMFGTGVGEDDDSGLFVKNHESYFTPKASDISRRIDWNSDTVKNRDLIKEMARYFYLKMIGDEEYLDEKYRDKTRLSDDLVQRVMEKEQFYGELKDLDVPGYSPLEKALAVFAKIKQQHGAQEEYAQSTLTQSLQGMEFHNEIISDPIFNELLDTNLFGKAHKMDILNKISMIKDLGSEFKIEKEIEEKLVANSSIIAKKIMRDYSQMDKIELYQRLMPNFGVKLLTKDLIVNVPVEKTEHKQKIIVLLDYSGSMNMPDKQEWVMAILVDRLKYAMKEEAEIFFSYFINATSQMHFTHIKDRASALAFWSKFSSKPSGGDTYLGDMVNYIKDEIQVRKRLHNLPVDLSEDSPEILAIADGQDSVKTSGFTYKTNAISLIDHENPELKRLCLANKGKYIFINKSEMRSYNATTSHTVKHK